MADQRRRGRGRSGKGGRIPRKGEGPAATSHAMHGETYVSFPLEVTGPIAVVSALDTAAVEATFGRVLEYERRQGAALQAQSESSGEPALAELSVQAERHRNSLEQLARDLGAELPAAGEAAAPADAWDLASGHRLTRLGWAALQRAAYASGDKRIDRVARPVLREKDRQAEVLDWYAGRHATRSLFPDPEE
jgi:hypothetical protein